MVLETAEEGEGVREMGEEVGREGVEGIGVGVGLGLRGRHLDSLFFCELMSLLGKYCHVISQHSGTMIFEEMKIVVS